MSRFYVKGEVKKRYLNYKDLVFFYLTVLSWSNRWGKGPLKVSPTQPVVLLIFMYSCIYAM